MSAKNAQILHKKLTRITC